MVDRETPADRSPRRGTCAFYGHAVRRLQKAVRADANGNWTANFQGTTYVRLTFAEDPTVPQGTMSIARSIHVDPQGNVDGVSEALSTPTRMRDVRWNDGVLSFGINDGPDVDRFELRLIDANHGELAPIFSEEERRQAAAEQSLPKPFQLAKTP